MSGNNLVTHVYSIMFDWPPWGIMSLLTRSCHRCKRFLPTWDDHTKCARHRTCNLAAPCGVCRLWSPSRWEKLNAWFIQHPEKQGSKDKVSKVSNKRHYKGHDAGSFSDSAIVHSDALDYSDDQSLDAYVELYASSGSEEDPSGHRVWLKGSDKNPAQSARRASATTPLSSLAGELADPEQDEASVSGQVSASTQPSASPASAHNTVMYITRPVEYQASSQVLSDSVSEPRENPSAQVPSGSASELRVNPKETPLSKGSCPDPEPQSQADTGRHPPSRGSGPGLFSRSRLARKRPGTVVSQAPRKRQAVATEAHTIPESSSNPVVLLERAAQMMGFSLHPTGVTNPGSNPPREVIPEPGMNQNPRVQPGINPGSNVDPNARVIQNPRVVPGMSPASVRSPASRVIPDPRVFPGSSLAPEGNPNPRADPGSSRASEGSRGSRDNPSLGFDPGYGSGSRAFLAASTSPGALPDRGSDPFQARGSRPPPAAALGAPPGEETYPVQEVFPVDDYYETESSFSGSVLSTDDPELAATVQQSGDKAQELLRKYLPQFYGTGQGEEAQTGPSGSLLFRSRADPGSGIPLTSDFQQEYGRIADGPSVRIPTAIRKSFKFQTKDFDKFLSATSLSPEILRIGDRKTGGNPLKGKSYTDADKKWFRAEEYARTAMRLSAYAGAVANLIAQADAFRVTPEDRQTLNEVLLSLSEALWSQTTRGALFASRHRRSLALQTLGFPSRDADQIAISTPHEGPHLFGGRAIQIFDDECAYRKRADETAARFLQPRKPWSGGARRAGRAARAPGRQVTVTVPAPAQAPFSGRGRGRFRTRGARRHGGRGTRRGGPRGGQGF